MVQPTPDRKLRQRASLTLERHSAAPDLSLVHDAQASFAALPFGEKLELAQLLAKTQRVEYTRSVVNVVAVTAGLRRRRSSSGDEEIHPEPCVVFIVRKKISEKAWHGTRQQRLPDYLLTPALVGDRKIIYAVPTDVQLQDRLLGASAQSDTGIFSRPKALGKADFGAISCMVADGNGTRYVVAPIHVLSPFPANDGKGIASKPALVFRIASSSDPPDSTTFVTPTRFGGRLAVGSIRSFDVQLAKVLDTQRLAQAFAGIILSPTQPFARSLQALGNLLLDGRRMEILVPNNNPKRSGQLQPPLRATLSLGETDQTIWYHFANDTLTASVLHEVLELQIEAGGATIGGDSGCPVVIPADDRGQVFVGMHIAGNTGAGTSYVIPAWQILNGLKYAEVGGELPAGGLRFVAPG